MSRRALLFAAALLAAVGLFARASAGAPAGAVSLTVNGSVRELAADGTRVALLLRSVRQGCVSTPVAVWEPASRRLVPVRTGPCLTATSTGSGAFGLALAGTRVGYVSYAGGNIRELELRTASIDRRQAATIASAAYGLGEDEGTYLGDLVGEGPLLVFGSWRKTGGTTQTSLLSVVASGAACPNAGLGFARRCAKLASLGAETHAVDLDAGRLVLRAPDGTVTVLGAHDETLASFPGPDQAVRLAGDDLVLLRRDGTRDRVVDLSVSTGAELHSWPLLAHTGASGDGRCGDPDGCGAVALRLESVAAGIALYVLGRDIHLLRLADGHEAVIQVPGRTPVHAQLTSGGLYYSYALTGRTSRLVFLPFATAAARIAP